MTQRPDIRRGSQLVAVLMVALGVFSGTSASAQLNLSLSQRAADGTSYEVLAVPNGTLLGGAEEVRVTGVAGSTVGLQPCSSIGATPGTGVASSIGGDQSMNPPQQLHPLASILRTGILSPNNETVTFNPTGATGSGRLTIGTGAGAIDVCLKPADCGGGAPDASLSGLSGSSGGVPAACMASGVTATCSSGSRSTIGFGLPASGSTCTAAPTTTSTVCGSRPSDGFTLGKGQVIVFVYQGNLGSTGFTFGASGFGIDTNGVSAPGCSQTNRIVTADAQAPSAPGVPKGQLSVGAPVLSWPLLVTLASVLSIGGFCRLQRPQTP